MINSNACFAYFNKIRGILTLRLQFCLLMFPSLRMRSLGRRDLWQTAPRHFPVFAQRSHQRGALRHGRIT